jgi:RHS repeat-associated protein
MPAQLIRYQFSNHLGSASLELDHQAQIISYEEYTAYGSTSYQAVRSQTETAKRYRYTGMERDEESGFNYHGARYYAPWLGRWSGFEPYLVLGKDTAPTHHSQHRDAETLLHQSSGYSYGFCNPIKFSDLTGHIPFEAILDKRGRGVSSPPGPRINPLTHEPQMHAGTDVGVVIGTPIRAWAEGKVVTSKYEAKGGGNYVVIEHEGGVRSVYMHQYSTMASQMDVKGANESRELLNPYNRFVKVGDKVNEGQVIGLSGTSGASTGPHFHLELLIYSPRLIYGFVIRDPKKEHIDDLQKEILAHNPRLTVTDEDVAEDRSKFKLSLKEGLEEASKELKETLHQSDVELRNALEQLGPKDKKVEANGTDNNSRLNDAYNPTRMTKESLMCNP